MFLTELLNRLKKNEIQTSAMQLLGWLAHSYYQLAYTHFCWALHFRQRVESLRFRQSGRHQ